MADDRPRPTENDNQDAENPTPRADETDSEAELDATDEAATDESDGDDVPEVDEEAVESEASEETTDETVAEPDADEAAVEPETNAEDADPRAHEAADEADEPSVESDVAAENDAATEDDATETEPATEDDPATGDEPAAEDESATENDPGTGPRADVPADVRKYERFKKMDGAQYDRVNEFLRERTYITAREWAIARLCADFRTETGVEMTKIGENLPELVPFMTDTYTPQAVNQARSSFETKVRQAGATFLYGAMSGFFTAEELDDMMYEVTEVAKFLLEVEGVDLSVEEELEAEDRISGVMREVQSASEQLRHDEMECPNCGHEMEASDSETIDSGSAGSDD